MKKSKILFLILALAFLMAIVFFIYDFSRKTTFPGSKKEMNQSSAADSVHN